MLIKRGDEMTVVILGRPLVNSAFNQVLTTQVQGLDMVQARDCVIQVKAF